MERIDKMVFSWNSWQFFRFKQTIIGQKNHGFPVLTANFKIAASLIMMLNNLGILIGNYDVIEFMIEFMDAYYEDLEPEGPFSGGPSFDFENDYGFEPFPPDRKPLTHHSLSKPDSLLPPVDSNPPSMTQVIAPAVAIATSFLLDLVWIFILRPET